MKKERSKKIGGDNLLFTIGFACAEAFFLKVFLIGSGFKDSNLSEL
jgi:hypothetical protein